MVDVRDNPRIGRSGIFERLVRLRVPAKYLGPRRKLTKFGGCSDVVPSYDTVFRILEFGRIRVRGVAD